MNISHTAFKRKVMMHNMHVNVYDHNMHINDGHAIIWIKFHTTGDKGFEIDSILTRTIEDCVFVTTDDIKLRKFINENKTLIDILKRERDALHTDICVDVINYILAILEKYIFYLYISDLIHTCSCNLSQKTIMFTDKYLKEVINDNCPKQYSTHEILNNYINIFNLEFAD